MAIKPLFLPAFNYQPADGSAIFFEGTVYGNKIFPFQNIIFHVKKKKLLTPHMGYYMPTQLQATSHASCSLQQLNPRPQV